MGRSGKVAVSGFLERGGKVRTEIIDNSKLTTLPPNVRKHVERGFNVCTDELHAYFGLQAEYVHEVIHHLRRTWSAMFTPTVQLEGNIRIC